jgi:peptidoglycan hydrolase-like protein with peptidoglycan-binding domain
MRAMTQVSHAIEYSSGTRPDHPIADLSLQQIDRRPVLGGKHLTVDGIVGPDTWSALIVQVSQGSTGDAVRGVQEEFQFRNLSGDPSKGLQIDGIFGPRTNAAVRGFQQALGLAIDGIVGPLTWRALVSGMLSG